MIKTCSKCKLKKDLCEFHKSLKDKLGFKSACKVCLNIENKVYAAKRRIKDRDLINKGQKKYRARKINKNPAYYQSEYLKYRDKIILRSREYYSKNKEKCLEKNKKWRQLNPEKIKNATAAWRKNNADKLKLGHQKWMQEHKDHVRIYNAFRRAQKETVTFQFTDEQLQQRMSVFGYSCAYCHGPFEHLDHVKPLSRGGLHCLSNLRPACKKCNLSKHNKSLRQWRNDFFKEQVCQYIL